VSSTFTSSGPTWTRWPGTIPRRVSRTGHQLRNPGSGGAGRTTSPTTPPTTAHSRPCCANPSHRRRWPRP